MPHMFTSAFSAAAQCLNNGPVLFLSGALCGALIRHCVLINDLTNGVQATSTESSRKKSITCDDTLKALESEGKIIARTDVEASRPEHSERKSITCDDALKALESEGKINAHLSPSDNAKANLERILDFDLENSVRMVILYAIHILKSDLSHSMTIPVGLSTDIDTNLTPLKATRRTSVHEPEVHDWLVLNYTSQKKSFRDHRKNAKRCSKAVRFAIKLYHEVPAETTNRYVIDVESKEMEDISNALIGVDEWDWDIWKLEDASKGRPLQTLGWHLLHKWGALSNFNLDEDVVRNWLAFVENTYQDNEYHNSLHAADVLQAVHFLLGRGGAAQYLPPLAVLALLLSAMIHDAGHDGRTNLYHQNAVTDRALTFNDHSIQENFHCMAVFSSMAQDPRLGLASTRIYCFPAHSTRMRGKSQSFMHAHFAARRQRPFVSLVAGYR